MFNPCVTLLELLGLVVCIGAWFCSLAATIMPQWRSQSSELLIIESYEVGLWESCVVHEVVGIECRAYESLLGLSHEIMLARSLMCISDAVGLLGIILAIPGLKLVKSCRWEGGWRVKRGLKIAAGVLFCTAGILTLIPVSLMAHDMVVKFHDHAVPEVVPRYEFGDAIFVGWAAGFLHVVGAILLFTSCIGMARSEPRLVFHQHHDQYKPTNGHSGKHTEYV